MDFTMPDRLMNENRISIFERNMEAYLRNKPRDCVLYSVDGAKFKVHKVLTYLLFKYILLYYVFLGHLFSKLFFPYLHTHCLCNRLITSASAVDLAGMLSDILNV